MQILDFYGYQIRTISLSSLGHLATALLGHRSYTQRAQAKSMAISLRGGLDIDNLHAQLINKYMAAYVATWNQTLALQMYQFVAQA